MASVESEEKNKDQKRTMPRNDLDYNMMMTQPLWGSNQINNELKDRVSKYFVSHDEDGNEVVTKESLWGMLSFYTQDNRLANLDNNEIVYCGYFLDLANDLLQTGMVQSFLICLSRVATVLELSQSRKGFLRKRMNTFSTEHTQQELEPPKKSLFGMKKKEG